MVFLCLQILETAFKASLALKDTSDNANVCPDLSSLRACIHDIASKTWINFLENEKKNITAGGNERMRSQLPRVRQQDTAYTHVPVFVDC